MAICNKTTTFCLFVHKENQPHQKSNRISNSHSGRIYLNEEEELIGEVILLTGAVVVVAIVTWKKKHREYSELVRSELTSILEET
jgi:hypothetical protein